MSIARRQRGGTDWMRSHVQATRPSFTFSGALTAAHAGTRQGCGRLVARNHASERWPLSHLERACLIACFFMSPPVSLAVSNVAHGRCSQPGFPVALSTDLRVVLPPKAPGISLSAHPRRSARSLPRDFKCLLVPSVRLCSEDQGERERWQAIRVSLVGAAARVAGEALLVAPGRPFPARSRRLQLSDWDRERPHAQASGGRGGPQRVPPHLNLFRPDELGPVRPVAVPVEEDPLWERGDLVHGCATRAWSRPTTCPSPT